MSLVISIISLFCLNLPRIEDELDDVESTVDFTYTDSLRPSKYISLLLLVSGVNLYMPSTFEIGTFTNWIVISI